MKHTCETCGKEYIHSMGQYFTKHETLQTCVTNFIKNDSKIILEPSIGRGDLVKCVTDKLPGVKFDMYEIDENIQLLDEINKEQVIYGDFMETSIENKYDTSIRLTRQD